MNIIKNTRHTYLTLLSGVFGLSLVFASCAPIDPYPSSQRTYEGAATGAAVGSVAGLLIDKDNRWRGAVIGGLIGAALGGTVTEISQRAAREAAAEGKPVAYESKDGFQRVEATPVSYNSNTDCHKIRERIWQDGELVKDEIKEVCDSKKSEPVY
ncbi:MAG: glycine zipper family protein [Candidatus Dadabacteria bacterium]|nr:glycine zipper family protein [Candidatus Dadabacteria bacterium]NIS08842.1 glycine zipper family protein [Candidatus Dadabacteria bacterium]NIV42792.1 glycine zipper 2TM domain-containing protein [Candidatus Dadabacteria bacterium]NIX16105.1 glycine zipper 2TM domain-containing protein [Candidatus Dadabacteria bacterium]NIY22192.1 glycine zipper 2TM domain-containing protein [Candidatus Dadabacteria bacterium]